MAQQPRPTNDGGREDEVSSSRAPVLGDVTKKPFLTTAAVRTEGFFPSTDTSSRIEWTAVFRASNRISSGTCRNRPCCTMTGANLEMRGRRPGFLGLLSPDAVAGNAHRCRCFPAKSHRIGLLLLGHCRPLPTQPSWSCLAVVMKVKSVVDRMGREAPNELAVFVYKTKAEILCRYSKSKGSVESHNFLRTPILTGYPILTDLVRYNCHNSRHQGDPS